MPVICYHCAGVPWDAVARNYTAQQINDAGILPYNITQRDVIAVWYPSIEQSGMPVQIASQHMQHLSDMSLGHWLCFSHARDCSQFEDSDMLAGFQLQLCQMDSIHDSECFSAAHWLDTIPFRLVMAGDRRGELRPATGAHEVQ